MSYVRHQAIRNMETEELMRSLIFDAMPSEQFVAMKMERIRRTILWSTDTRPDRIRHFIMRVPWRIADYREQFPEGVFLIDYLEGERYFTSEWEDFIKSAPETRKEVTDDRDSTGGCEADRG